MDPLARPWDQARRDAQVVALLVRHGQTEWNASRRFLGQTDIALDEVGRAQARRAADRLSSPPARPFAAVYSSPLSRALETARAFHPDPIVVPGLAELNQGELEGLEAPAAFEQYPDFFQAWMQDPGSARVPGGEALSELRDRALHALSQIVAAHAPGEVIGVYSHQMVISSLTCVARGWPLSRWRECRVGNAHATALAWTPEGPRVVVQRVPLGEDAEHA